MGSIASAGPRKAARCRPSHRLLVALAATALFSGCGGVSGDTPVAPTPASSPPAGEAGQQRWLLDWWLVSVSGDDNCFKRDAGSWSESDYAKPLVVELLDSAVRFTYLPDGTVYSGPLRSRDFEATAVGWNETVRCTDGTELTGRLRILLEGSFSEDWRAISAVETWRHEFEGAGTVDVRYQWSAYLPR